MKKNVYQKGTIVFREGDAGNSMYIIRAGSVGIYCDYGKEDEKKLVELHKEDSFGELSILESEDRSATAIVMENGTELEEIDSAGFDAFLKEHPDFAKQAMLQMSRRIRDLTNDYMAVCRTVVDIHQAETSGAQKSPELSDRMKQVVDIYQNRYPTLFNITMKEAKDDVRFVFSA